MPEMSFDPLASRALTSYPEESAVLLRRYPGEELVALFAVPPDADDSETQRTLRAFARFFISLTPVQQSRLVAGLPADLVARILVAGRGAEARALINQLDDAQRAEVLALCPAGERKHIEALFDAHRGTASSLMGNDYLRVVEEETVGEVASRLRGSRASEELPVYCVDRQGVLIGSIPPLRLVTAETGTRAGDVARRVIAIGHLTPVEMLRQASLWGELTSLPVVSRDNRLVGVIDRRSVELDDNGGAATLGASLFDLFDDYVKVSSELTELTLGGRR